MGVSAAAVGLLLDLRRRGLLDEVRSVVETGAQELHLSAERLRAILAAEGVGYDDTRFAGAENWPGRPRARARALYELLGATDYASIDLNGEDGAIPHDLNRPFEDEEQLGRYDLVTDHGSVRGVGALVADLEIVVALPAEDVGDAEASGVRAVPARELALELRRRVARRLGR